MKTNYKSLANAAWKVENLSLSGIIRYANRTKEPNFLAFLKEIGLKPADVTFDLIKSGANEESFFSHNKMKVRTGEKKYFSLWFALSCLKNRVTAQANEVKEAAKEAAKLAKLAKLAETKTVKKAA
jgi:hypothetical protein